MKIDLKLLKILSFALVILLVAPLISSSAFGEEKPLEYFNIETTATGTVEAPPDMAEIYITVKNESLSKDTAQKENAQRVQELTKALSRFKVEVKTTYFYNYQFKEEESAAQPMMEGSTSSQIYPTGSEKPVKYVIKYVVESGLKVIANDVKEVGDILAVASNVNNSYVNSVQYGVKNVSAYRKQAINEAIRQARESIEISAEGLGAKLVRPEQVRVDFGNPYYYPVVKSAEMAKLSDAYYPQPQNPEPVKITATVYMVYKATLK
ncbi:MAG: SIMPL domain-containing protein [Thermovenabulum sp.]|uniref:SIMPL domain-containing protein n=1 Tax=Thermovenabulum sp. TaxID=3100335 RepID=UPI003C7A379C